MAESKEADPTAAHNTPVVDTVTVDVPMASLGEKAEPTVKDESAERLNAALEEMTVYKQELEDALEDSNARLSTAERELAEVKEQCDEARARLDVSTIREKEMQFLQAQLADMQAQLEQANVELERERKQWLEQVQAEKDASEHLRGSLEAVRLQLETESQKHIAESEQQRLAWVAKEKELWSMVEAARAETVVATPTAQAVETDISVVPEAPAANMETGLESSDSRDGGSEIPEEEEKKTVGPEEKVGPVNGEVHPEEDLKKGMKGLDPSMFLNVDAWVSAATLGDGTTTPLAVNEDALRKNLQSALARLEGMQEIQEKWRKQVERMDEVETEWKARLADLEQERDDLMREVELLQEDLRREQDLAMEAGMVAEEEWRKRQECERDMAELQREVAKHKKVAKEALMCIPRASLADIADTPGMDVLQLLDASPLAPMGLTESASGDTDFADIKLSDADRGLGGTESDFMVSGGDAVGSPTTHGSLDALEAGLPKPDVSVKSLADVSEAGVLSAASSPKELVMEDAGGLRDMVPSLEAAAGDHSEDKEVQEGEEGEEPQKTLARDESLLRLGQELGTLRKEVLELRMKLAEMRDQLNFAEEAKKEAQIKRAFGKVCLQLVTNAKDKFEDQIAMATRHALEASQKARETDKQLYALLADISSLLKEHQVQAKNNGSTYNRYKIGKQEIDIVKEDLRQLVKMVQMKATLAEKSRQKSKTKVAEDAARKRVAELRDGAIQDEEVLAELEKELEEARKRTEEAEAMQNMVAQMREKERQVREHVEKEVRAVQAKMQEAEIMKQQVEALKQTEQVLAKELAEEVKELKVKSLEAEEVEGRITALEATESVIREEMEAKTRNVREIDRQFPRLMGLGLGSELPPPGLLGRKPQEELAWKDKRKVLEDLKVMKEQLIWTQSSLLKSRQRLPELIQEAKDCKRRVEEKEKETKRVQQWLKDHDAGLIAAKSGGEAHGLRHSITGSWGNWWHKKKEETEVPHPQARQSSVVPGLPRLPNMLPHSSSDEHGGQQTPRAASAHLSSPARHSGMPKMSSPARAGMGSPGNKSVPSLVPLEGQRSSDSRERQDLQQRYQQHLIHKQQQQQQMGNDAMLEGPKPSVSPAKEHMQDFVVGSKAAGVREIHMDNIPDMVVLPNDE